jgi:hypothetical protein
MTQYKVQSIECQGIPCIEFRHEPEIYEPIEICFTPTFANDEYAYTPPKFVFGDEVIIAERWNFCQENNLNFEEEGNIYRLCALELVEVSLVQNRLYQAPYWMYGIRGTKGSNELVWFSEDALMNMKETSEPLEF